jgi:hypothetical protein
MNQITPKALWLTLGLLAKLGFHNDHLLPHNMKFLNRILASLLLVICVFLSIPQAASAQAVSISIDTSVKSLPLLLKIDTIQSGRSIRHIRIELGKRIRGVQINPGKFASYMNLDTSSLSITPIGESILEISGRGDSTSIPEGVNIPLMRFLTDSSEWLQSFTVEFLNKNRQVIRTQQLEIMIPVSLRSLFPGPCSQSYHGFSTVDLNNDQYADSWMAADGDLHTLPPTAGFGSAKVTPYSSDGANWVTPYSSSSTGANAPGYYTYRMTFCASAPASALINMKFAVDDYAKVYFNGTFMGSFGAVGWQPVYTIANAPVSLVVGENVLDFVVQNVLTSYWSSYFTGIRVNNAAVTTQTGVLGLQSNYCCAPGWIAGTKLWDKNCNGSWDLGENPLNGWTIELLDQNGQVIQQQLTGPSGHYQFQVPAGTYTVRENMTGHPGWTPSVSAGPYTNIVVGPTQVEQRDFLNCSPFVCEDLFSQQEQSDECCKASFTISNGYNVALQSVQYVVNGGVINSINAGPCLPTAQSPANLNNTTAGNLTFATACTVNDPMQFDVNATATNSTGLVEIIWTATFQDGSNTFSCNDTTYIQCERAPLVCNTQVDVVQSLTGLSGDMREFTITNLKTPPSPISSVDISYNAEPAPRHRGDINLYADNFTMRPWTIANSGGLGNEYTQIRFNCSGTTEPHGPAAVNWVKVTMGIDLSLNPPYSTPGYSGTVHFKVSYCDGDTCEYDYLWEPPVINSQSNGIVEQPTLDNVRMFKLGVTLPDSAASFRITLKDTAAVIIAITAPSPSPEADSGNLFGLRVASFGNSALYTPGFSNGPKIKSSYHTLNVVYTPGASSTSDSIPIIIRYYSQAGREIAQAEKEIKNVTLSADRPTIAPPQGGSINSIIPNPATDAIKLTYTIGASEDVRIELFNTLGDPVGIVTEGWQQQGSHTIEYNVGSLPEGNYLLRLTTRFGTTATSLKLIR